jgi:hypothetical protein
MLVRQFVEFEELFSRKLTLVMSWQEVIFGQERIFILESIFLKKKTTP